MNVNVYVNEGRIAWCSVMVSVNSHTLDLFWIFFFI